MLNQLKVNTGIIEYCKLGEGKPLILVIGYASTINGWDRRFLHYLSQKFQVIVFNNRNTGSSYSANKHYTVKDLADDIEALRIGLNLGKVAVGGISMGGMIAQQYASSYPDNLTQLILINTLAPGELHISPGEDVISVLKDLKYQRIINYWRMLRLSFPSTCHVYLVLLYYFKPPGSRFLISSKAIIQQQPIIAKWSETPNPERVLAKIKAPTLIMYSGLDKIIPPQNSEIISKYIPNSKLVFYQNGGHIMMFQYPYDMANKIIEFISHNTN